MSQSTDSDEVISPLWRPPSKKAAGLSVAGPVALLVSVTCMMGRPSSDVPTW